MNQPLLLEPKYEHPVKAQRDLHQDYPFSDAGRLNAEWKKLISNAKISWGKLTEQELIRSGGHRENLSKLVHERYAISRVEAERQVNAFLQKKYC